jgi:uncharacterized protein (DUF433 family)
VTRVPSLPRKPLSSNEIEVTPLVDENGAMKTKRAARKKLFGKYVVADPEICHGKVTFLGTRIFVKDVLDMVAAGMSWDHLIKEWHGSITREAISEAISLASPVFLERLNAEFREEHPLE